MLFQLYFQDLNIFPSYRNASKCSENSFLWQISDKKKRRALMVGKWIGVIAKDP